jgi:RNA polymerase sigma-70 factor (ECF subfamily)
VSDRDQTHLQQARAFDQSALTAIYDEYHRPIYRYVYRQVSDVETARDLTSEVFRRLLQALKDSGGPDQHLSGWLYRTARNTVVDHYRRQQHRQHLPLFEELVNTDEDPVAMAEQQIKMAQVRAVLQRLTPDQQHVIALRFLEGLSTSQVAELLDKPVSAVKSLQHRALAALQRHLAPGEEKVLP